MLSYNNVIIGYCWLKSSEVNFLMDKEAAQKLLEKLNAVKMNFVTSLGGRKEAIVNAKNDLEQNGYSPERVALLHNLVHSLAGTSAAFQFKELSDVCSVADLYLRPFVKENKEFKDEYIPEVVEKVNIIEQFIDSLK